MNNMSSISSVKNEIMKNDEMKELNFHDLPTSPSNLKFVEFDDESDDEDCNKTNKIIINDDEGNSALSITLTHESESESSDDEEFPEYDTCACGYKGHNQEFDDGTWGEQLCPKCWEVWNEERTLRLRLRLYASCFRILRENLTADEKERINEVFHNLCEYAEEDEDPTEEKLRADVDSLSLEDACYSLKEYLEESEGCLELDSDGEEDPYKPAWDVMDKLEKKAGNMKEKIQETGAASITITLSGGKIKVTHGTTGETLLHSAGMVKEGTWKKLFANLEDLI